MFVFFYCCGNPRHLHSFPTRRSSDLVQGSRHRQERGESGARRGELPQGNRRRVRFELRDRKSTRLNSSHSSISYAVFCLKKKRWNSRSVRIPTSSFPGLHLPLVLNSN